jgi:CheY-like chemotaxis protein
MDRHLLSEVTPFLPSCNVSGLHVLLAEDNPFLAQIMADWLRHDGHRVQLAADGLSACRIALNGHADVVLLDVGLPGMDGWQVTRQLRAQLAQKMPLLIAITGHGGEENRRRSFEAGIDYHLVKPVDLDFLRQLLNRFHQAIKLTDAGPTEKGEPPIGWELGDLLSRHHAIDTSPRRLETTVKPNGNVWPSRTTSKRPS